MDEAERVVESGFFLLIREPGCVVFPYGAGLPSAEGKEKAIEYYEKVIEIDEGFSRAAGARSRLRQLRWGELTLCTVSSFRNKSFSEANTIYMRKEEKGLRKNIGQTVRIVLSSLMEKRNK